MPPRILIVDDSLMVRSLLRRTFESEPGWEISGEAANGKEAIEKAQETHPNCIVLDLSMPVMNGLEAARALHKLMPLVPLLMFTSFMTGNLEREAHDSGVDHVYIKSNPVSELVGGVRSIVKDGPVAA